MLYHFFNFINNYLDFPGSGLFEFISFRAGMAVITSLFITLIFGGKLIDYLHKKAGRGVYKRFGLRWSNGKNRNSYNGV